MKVKLVISPYLLLNVALDYLLFHMLHVDSVCCVQQQVIFCMYCHTKRYIQYIRTYIETKVTNQLKIINLTFRLTGLCVLIYFGSILAITCIKYLFTMIGQSRNYVFHTYWKLYSFWNMYVHYVKSKLACHLCWYHKQYIAEYGTKVLARFGVLRLHKLNSYVKYLVSSPYEWNFLIVMRNFLISMLTWQLYT